MRTIKTRAAPEAPNFFTTQIGVQEVQCRLPNFAARQEMLNLCRFTGDGDANNGGGPDVVRSMAAILGCCWWGTDRVLEADYFRHRRDLVQYGDLVLTELEAEGFRAEDIIAAASVCLEAVIASIPTEEEVAEAEDFTEAGVPV